MCKNMDNLNIGGVPLKSHAVLAPMAGVSDRAYRELCVRFGAAYCVSEMVSSKALSFNSKKSEELMEISDLERPCGIQIFGDDPKCMADAAKHALENKPDIIDINMGCPAPKISSNGSGSALMKNPRLCGEIVKAVTAVTDIPVTVKIRKGWDDDSVNAVEVAKICESAGAAAITVHGRTRQQYYKPPVDYDIIRAVRESVSVPVIANGDIDSAERAKEVMDITGCDLVMIGRATLGNPWIFSQINAYLENPNVKIHTPDLEERLGVMIEHIGKMVEYKGEHMAMLQARKLVVGYFKGMKGAAALRNEAGKIKTLDDLYELRQKAFRCNDINSKRIHSILK
ncbi:tRNA dihydrouridine synthase DusB [Ruminococcus bromii]|nr:tRNA dihydrouridine synthase DusB [Ruminococcus bromii]